jgi:hypothetical protein
MTLSQRKYFRLMRHRREAKMLAEHRCFRCGWGPMPEGRKRCSTCIAEHVKKKRALRERRVNTG